jgi:hypothetical protein
LEDALTIAKTYRDCDCVKKLAMDNIRDGSIFLLVGLVNQEKALGDTQLKGMVVAANQNHLTTQQLMRKFWQTTRTTVLNNALSSHLAQNRLSGVDTSSSFSSA